MTVFQLMLMTFLIVCAVSASFSKNLLNSVLIYMSFSLVMSILWVCLESPDLAITEADVGYGMTSLRCYATLKKRLEKVIEREVEKQQREQEK